VRSRASPARATALPAAADVRCQSVPRVATRERARGPSISAVKPAAVTAVVTLAALLSSACGYTARASLGPTVTTGGKGGAEAAIEVGTHLIGTKIVSLPVTLRLQATRFFDETLGFVGLSIGDTVNPGFYGRDPLDMQDGKYVDTRGWGGHLAGAIGGNSDGTAGLRVGLGVGRGRGRVMRDGDVQFRSLGGELAWQGDFESVGEGDDARVEWPRHRFTAAVYVDLTRVPGKDIDFPFDFDIGPSKK
jgi:hypothetical protein